MAAGRRLQLKDPMRDEGMKEFLSVKDAADLVSVSEVTIRRMLWHKKLKRFKFAGRTLVNRAELLKLVEAA
jgi:excisionase family DNA binding protein